MTTPTNREAVNWENKFIEVFTEFRINQADQYQAQFKPYTDPDEVLQFIRQTHLDLLREVETHVQDHMDGFANVLTIGTRDYDLYQLLEHIKLDIAHIITRVEGGNHE